MSITPHPFHVLFICTGNSARSIIAEAILNHLGSGRFVAFSAGSEPRGEVHPLALHELQQHQIPTSGLSSKHWDRFAQHDAPTIDFIFTVCDRAAAEPCPVWPGHPLTAHWGIPDPAAATGAEVIRKGAFAKAYRELYNRVSSFVELPLASLDTLRLQQRLTEIHQHADGERVAISA